MANKGDKDKEKRDKNRKTKQARKKKVGKKNEQEMKKTKSIKANHEREKEETKKTDEERKKEEEFLKKLKEQMEKITVKDVVMQMMTSLSSLGYQKLGLPEEQNKKYLDLKQAKLAIDALAALVSACEKNLSHEEYIAYKNTLSNLQITYVGKSK
ncbi:MAG: DUF1844 domain-containing protein [Actinobacteria bacterium]|nr:DUF1844 domain-containing protein [Actinomycetota bacterium]